MITKRDLMLSIASIEEELEEIRRDGAHRGATLARLECRIAALEEKGVCKCAKPEGKRRGRPVKNAETVAQPRDKSGKFAKK